MIGQVADFPRLLKDFGAKKETEKTNNVGEDSSQRDGTRDGGTADARTSIDDDFGVGT